MSKLPRVGEELIDQARRGHDPTPEELARTLHALHARLDFHGQPARPRRAAAAAAAAAVAADVVVASTTKAASAVTGKLALKLIVATMALGGGVTTAVMVHERSQPVAVVAQSSRAAPHALAQGAAAGEPAPQVDAITEPAPDVAPLASASEPARALRGTTRRPSEMTLIGRALASLRDRDPKRTLALLDEHAELYPRGKFVTERKGLRVLALCASGRIEEGRRARAAFMRESARAPIAARVREACNEEP